MNSVRRKKGSPRTLLVDW